jgi:hypothetical protein
VRRAETFVRPSKVIREWRQTHGGAARVDRGGIAQPGCDEALGARADLSAVELRLATRQQHPVGEMGEVRRRSFTTRDRTLEQLETTPLERRMPVSMLSD